MSTLTVRPFHSFCRRSHCMRRTEAREGNVRKALAVVQALPKAFQGGKAKAAAAAGLTGCLHVCAPLQSLASASSSFVTRPQLPTASAPYRLAQQPAFYQLHIPCRPSSQAPSFNRPERACANPSACLWVGFGPVVCQINLMHAAAAKPTRAAASACVKLQVFMCVVVCC